MFFRKVNSKTDKIAMDSYDSFDHPSRPCDIETWLKRTYSEDSFRKKRYDKIISLMFGDREKLKVLEIGAGTGDFSLYCKKKYSDNEYNLSDPSEIFLKKNLEKVKKFFNIADDNINTSSFSAEDIRHDDNYFDLIMVRAAVHHFGDPHKAFNEIHRCLRPGGRLIFFNEPICLNIPIYKNILNYFIAWEEKKMGFNDSIYPLAKYLSFGKRFSKKEYILDSLYLDEFKGNLGKWIGLKRFIGNKILSNDFLLRNYLIFRFQIPLIFIYHK